MGKRTEADGKLGERLRELRQMAELSARGLSELAGVSPPYTSMIEAGQRTTLSFEVVSGYAAALGCRPEWLIGGTGRRPSKSRVLAAVKRARLSAAA